MIILAADVGGTKTNIALVSFQGRTVRPFLLRSFPSRQFANLERIVRTFVSAGGPRVRVDGACFGVAGPVVRGTCHTLNLPWTVSQRRLQAALPAASVHVINDLEAMAYGTARLSAKDVVTIHRGRPQPRGNRALIAAGTGLGEAMLWWDGAAHRPSASEGGHADFAPRTALEMDLLRWLQREHAHVSYERVVSGPGLVRLYRFLRLRTKTAEPRWLTSALRDQDAGAVITQAGLARRERCCRQALEIFVSLYGAEAGNLAMKALATGGVYLGGGIAPKILPLLRQGGFLRAFLDKGRMRRLLADIPVRVIVNEHAALWGAAHYAWLQRQKGL